MQTSKKSPTKFANQCWQDKLFDIFNYTLVAVVLLLICYPIYFIFIASFSDPDMVANGQVVLLPKGLNLASYAQTFGYGDIWSGYLNSVINTVLGTCISLMCTLPAAYALSRKDLPGNKLLMGLITFTMFFSGGLIPTYMLVQNLHLYNTRAILLMLGAVSAYNLIIAKSFMATNIPHELYEATQIDGGNDFIFFFRVVVQLSVPIISVLVLLYAVAQWNSYFNALIYIKDRALYPLQVILRELLIQTESSAMMGSGGSASSIGEARKLANMMKYSVIIVSSLPLLVMYGLLSKHFEKGMMVGAIKG